MTPLERQFALKARKITQHAIAVKLGVSDVSVSDVILNRMVSDRIMKTIATEMGEDHRLVFSEYYLRPAKRRTSKIDQAA